MSGMAWWRSRSLVPGEISDEDLPLDFGRYQLQELIGRGGMGLVFRAWLLGPAGFRKELALKLIRSVDPSERTRQRFLNEARLGAMLDHPNLVSTQDLGEHQGQLFIAMDLVRGIGLDALLQHMGPLSGTATMDVAVQLCAGLAAAHGSSRDGGPGLVHCDLKPGNVLLSDTGLARLTDFGLAQALDPRHGPVGLRFGTLNYMPPEQLLGASLDCRADIYSLGLVIAEMVTGQRFFDEDERQDLGAAILAVDARMADPFVRAPLDTAVPGLSAVLDRCICEDPDARFASVVALGHALRDLLPGVRDGRSLVELLELAGVADSQSLDYSMRDSSQPLRSSRPATEDRLGPEPDRFVGREADLARLEHFVSEGGGLITIKGPGGSGKTRLARRLGRRLQGRLSGGVWFCDLSECGNLRELLQEVGSTLDLPLSRGEPDELVLLLGHVLRGHGSSLLVLDNFEQLAEHAPATLNWWRTLAPETVLLVTSRTRLKLAGEKILELDSLSAAEGVSLLLARAEGWSAGEVDEAHLLEIVRRLDGLPLAIELAASRSRLLSPPKLLERLTERFKLLRSQPIPGKERGATLWATIDWSWELLESWEQAALSQLSVFRGGFFLEEAEEVLDLEAYPDAPWAMDVVGGLLDSSLLFSRSRLGQPRFGMYESIRDYASQRLASSGDRDGARKRHARCFAALGTQESRDALYVHGGLERLHRMLAERENLLAGFEAALALGEASAARGCALAAMKVLERTGPLEAGRSIGQQALDAGGLREEERLQLMRELAWIQSLQGQVEPAIAMGLRALALAQRLGVRAQEARIHSNLAFMYQNRLQMDRAEAHYECALELAREVGNRPLEGVILSHQGSQWMVLNREGARQRLESAVGIAQEVGNSQSEAHARGNLAMLCSRQGEVQAALAHFWEAIGLCRAGGNRRLEGSALSGLAELLCTEGRLDEAMEACLAALAIHRRLGNRVQECIALGNMGDIHIDQGDGAAAAHRLRAAIALGDEVLPSAAGAFRGSLGLLLGLEGAVEEARTLLDRGADQLRGDRLSEMGKLLCKRARLELAAGEEAPARAALEQARSIADELQVRPAAALARAIVQVQEQIDGQG